jgi:hypothetical protein
MNIPRLKEFLFAPLCLCRDFANRRRAILLLIFAFSAALPSSATCPQQHLGIIVLPSQPRASALLEQLRNGWDFGVLAKENSIDPTGNEGGYLGRFAPDELQPQYVTLSPEFILDNSPMWCASRADTPFSPFSRGLRSRLRWTDTRSTQWQQHESSAMVWIWAACRVDGFENNGLLDVIVSSADVCDPLHYFHNDGDGSFINRSRESGLSDPLGGLNIVEGDYNNDGCIDFLVLRGGWEFGMRKSLLRNNCNGTFTDVADV